MKTPLDKSIFSLSAPDCFDLALCLDCGQAFRWKLTENNLWHGVVGKTSVDIEIKDSLIILYGIKNAEETKIFEDYFDLSRDYTDLIKPYSADESLGKAIKEYYGIRILKQEPWETLCSFIISQNNNIPRIKGIISRLCQEFGEQINENDYSFPSAERLSVLSVQDLAPLRCGFRAKYIIDAAQKIASNEVDFEKIALSDIDFGRSELIKIKGVGAKVAECTLLYGFNKLEAFPIDVWVKRILSELYPNGLPDFIKGSEGVAQQYLFHWRRQQHN